MAAAYDGLTIQPLEHIVRDDARVGCACWTLVATESGEGQGPYVRPPSSASPPACTMSGKSTHVSSATRASFSDSASASLVVGASASPPASTVPPSRAGRSTPTTAIKGSLQAATSKRQGRDARTRRSYHETFTRLQALRSCCGDCARPSFARAPEGAF